MTNKTPQPLSEEQLLKQIAYDYGLPESDLIKRYGKEINNGRDNKYAIISTWHIYNYQAKTVETNKH